MLTATKIKKQFGHVKAVDDVSLTIQAGETVGLVGESGCGKSTLGRILLGLISPTDGTVTYEGKNIHAVSPRERKTLCKELQIIFQDPTASLNPRFRVIDTLSEPLHIHKLAQPSQTITPRTTNTDKGSNGTPTSKAIDNMTSTSKAMERATVTRLVDILLEKVGLDSSFKYRYPHELSGGEKQRVGIARALATQPKFIVADEPVSSLDVSIQAQILELLHTLKKSEGLTMLFISHDLNVVRLLCDRIAVMYFGNIVELATAEAIFTTPQHPYTKTLLEATLVADPTRRKLRS